MPIFVMTIHIDGGNTIDYEIDAPTPNEALDLLWKTKKGDWIRIDTNMSYTEFVNANRIVKITSVVKEVESTLGKRNPAFTKG